MLWVESLNASGSMMRARSWWAKLNIPALPDTNQSINFQGSIALQTDSLQVHLAVISDLVQAPKLILGTMPARRTGRSMRRTEMIARVMVSDWIICREISFSRLPFQIFGRQVPSGSWPCIRSLSVWDIPKFPSCRCRSLQVSVPVRTGITSEVGNGPSVWWLLWIWLGWTCCGTDQACWHLGQRKGDWGSRGFFARASRS